jgi:hypothetical protein
MVGAVARKRSLDTARSLRNHLRRGMRGLFSSTGGAGHLQPLLPLAVAFAARGDAMKVAAPRNHRARVEAEGLELAEVGPTPEALRAEALAHQHRVGQLPVPARRPVAFSGLFGKLEAPARLNGLRSLLEQWSPAVVIYESADLAAPIAAAEAGTRFLNHAFGPAIPEAALKDAAVSSIYPPGADPRQMRPRNRTRRLRITTRRSPMAGQWCSSPRAPTI